MSCKALHQLTSACLSQLSFPRKQSLRQGFTCNRMEVGVMEQGRQAQKQSIQGCITKLVTAKNPSKCILGQSIIEKFICWASYGSKVIIQGVNIFLQLTVAQENAEYLTGQHQQRNSRVRRSRYTAWSEGHQILCTECNAQSWSITTMVSGVEKATKGPRNGWAQEALMWAMQGVWDNDSLTRPFLTLPSPTLMPFTVGFFDLSKHMGLHCPRASKLVILCWECSFLNLQRWLLPGATISVYMLSS